MKRLSLAVGLCIAGFLLAPVASASAEPLTGTCVITGSAKFNPNLTSVEAEVEYKFEGIATCATTAGPQSGTAVVHGKFKGECAKATSTTLGEGELVGHKFKDFEFTAAAGLVAFKVEGGLPGGSSGLAEFYTSGSPLTPGQLASECASTPGGVSSLGFGATASGTLQ